MLQIIRKIPSYFKGKSEAEIRSRSALGREAMNELTIIMKNDDISVNAKIRIVNALVFRVVLIW